MAIPTASVALTESRDEASIRLSSGVPATYSIARPITPRASSIGSASKRTTLGCSTWQRARASSTIRSRAAVEVGPEIRASSSPAGSSEKSFTAAVRSSVAPWISFAGHTGAKPPRPSAETRKNGPSRRSASGRSKRLSIETARRAIESRLTLSRARERRNC